ncbi:brain-specific angiogenesis inhibitor 1-associated protein 2 isoform X2 [Tachysurus fulvidraco]|uniref:brain-specific angiogenesis inhibitor 1-associated protein 2 isoform X2 n=1 Tax=Tachysurus fulvidraco TaxID=1234273 RepID=UPI001FED69BB|nr:brain-specific angiogenesis inhibitor 1-associated protein 2 isoform X2 [Tachysurus fulvidraco]
MSWVVFKGIDTMSRSDEVNKMTENVYKSILEQFNPSLKNFVTMGKHYEKALTGVTVAAKGYFDALVKLGELASDSQSSKELGDTLFQMAEVHRQIQVQLEDVLKLFHSELLSQLEQKLDLDIKFLTATLKKYQTERRSKAESIERCHSQLKKLRRKSQSSRHPNKYGDREMQFVELMSRKQTELDSLVAVGYRSALTEERRRYCFLVDRQCSVAKLIINYHSKVRELMSQKLSSWQQSCSQPTKLPERALNLLRHTAPQGAGASGIADVLRHTKLGSAQSGEQEVPPLLNGDSSSRSQQQRGGSSVSSDPTPRTISTQNSATYNTSTSSSLGQPQTSVQSGSGSSLLSPPTGSAFLSLSPASASSLNSLQGLAPPPSAPHTPQLPHSAPLSRALTPVPPSAFSPPPFNPLLLRAADVYATSTLPLPRKQPNEMQTGILGSTLPRVLPLSPPLRVEALFSHSPSSSDRAERGERAGSCLLSFLPGDIVGLLISEPRDGWHYGQNERTGRKGWFPFSYTQPLPNTLTPTHHDAFSSPGLSKLNSTSMGQLDRLPPAGEFGKLSPDSEEERGISTFRPRPYSMMNPDIRRTSPGHAEQKGKEQFPDERSSPPPSPTRTNPFAHIHLRKTVTNDRSAPLIE